MIGHWIAFALILVAVVLGWIGLYQLAKEKKALTKQEKKNFDQNMIVMSAFIVLADCFYMTCFNRWDIASFILGGLLTLIVFYNLWNIFLSLRPRSFLEKWCSLIDFLAGIGVSVYLVYIVPDAVLQTILTTIIAAVYGGMLTLAGVALTIRWTNKQAEEQHKNSVRPFFYVSLSGYGHVGGKEPVRKLFGDINGSGMKAIYGSFENSDKVEFLIRDITVEGKTYQCVAANVVAKGEVFSICVHDDKLAEMIPNGFCLTVEDIDGSVLHYSITLALLKNHLVPTKIELLKENNDA